MNRTMARVLGSLRAVAVRIAAQWSAHPLRAVDEVSGMPFTGDQRRRTKSPAIAALLLLTAVPANAQEPFSSVQHLLRVGDTVFVTDHNNGITKKGKLVQVGPSSVRLAMDGTEREWAATDVRVLERRGDSVTDGAVRGAVTGALLGAVSGAIAGATWANSGSGTTPARGALGCGMLSAFIGTGIGLAIDALIQGRTTIYQRPSSISVVPALSPGHGVAECGGAFLSTARIASRSSCGSVARWRALSGRFLSCHATSLEVLRNCPTNGLGFRRAIPSLQRFQAGEQFGVEKYARAFPW
jgi:hypothetical protein